MKLFKNNLNVYTLNIVFIESAAIFFSYMECMKKKTLLSNINLFFTTSKINFKPTLIYTL